MFSKRLQLFTFTFSLLSFSLLCSQTLSPDFTPGPDMNTARMSHHAVVLNGQNVMLLGGHGASFVALNNSECFQASADTFNGQAMNYAHDLGAVAKLHDGRILIAGGAEDLGVAPGYNTAEIYNPADQSYTPTANLNYARTNCSAATLNNGKVLIVGGWYNANSAGYGEVFNPDSGSFKLTGALNTARSNPITVPTADGGAIIIGGIPAYGGTPIEQVEYYDPATNSFSVLKEYLFDSEDHSWLLLNFEHYNRQIEMQQTMRGDYVFIAYNNIAGYNQYCLFTVDPVAKTITKMPGKTELANSNTHYFYTPIVDKEKYIAYLPAVQAGQDPTKLDLFAFDLNDSTVYTPDTTYTFPEDYYLYGASFQLLSDGRILVSGGHSQTGYNTNFSPINKTLFITPNYEYTSLEEMKPVTEYKLKFNNYPNPFNNTTKFEFELARAGNVTLEVYNIVGQLVARVAQGQFSSGKHIVRWEANTVGSGVYFCMLTTPANVQFRKITLIK